MLKLKDLTVKIGKKEILHRINFYFQKGKVYAVMGQNGSGKSTLAMSIMGHPSYHLTRGAKILFNNKNIARLRPEKRAKLGIFLSFQTPLSLAGVNIFQLLRYALEKKESPVKIKTALERLAKDLDIDNQLLQRSINEGFSGGEKKKMEVIQAMMLNPKLIIFDEIDTGVDVDALKAIAHSLKKLNKIGKTIILITHYNRILKHLRPNKILVMKNGRLVKVGDQKLADKIEEKGYDNI